MKIISTLLILLVLIVETNSQSLTETAENIRQTYQIPELGFAVVDSNSIIERQNLGVKRINSKFCAASTDKFHIGSNTKAITGFIAALLVKQHKINWNTKFFDLFPELKTASNQAFYEITLQDLLTFRAKLPPYTYSNPLPKKSWFRGSYEKQRFQLVKWFLKQKSNESSETLSLTNAGFIAAGLMLEKAAGKSYKELVKDLGEKIGIDFGFDYPNLSDKSQTWGHNVNLKALPPKENYKLNWLLSAGNISVNLPDYAKFIQLQLRGLSGQSDLLTKQEFNFLHFGFEEFAVGWFWKINENKHQVSFNTGNAGAFITQVYVIPEIDKAYIIFANSATEKTSRGMSILLNEMIKRYGN